MKNNNKSLFHVFDCKETICSTTAATNPNKQKIDYGVETTAVAIVSKYENAIYDCDFAATQVDQATLLTAIADTSNWI